MPSLFTVNKQIAALLAQDEIDMDTGEVLNEMPDSAREAIDDLGLERGEIVLEVGKNILNELSKAEGIRDAVKVMLDRAKRHENTAERSRRYIQMNVEPSERFECAEVEISWRKSERLVISEGADIPEQFLRRKEVVEPDKKLIKEAIGEGEAVDGCWIQPHQNLQVK